MAWTFLVSLVGIALLFTTLCKYELTAKHTRAQLRALRRLSERRTGSDSSAPVRRTRSAVPSLHATTMTAQMPQTKGAGVTNGPRNGPSL
jgi:hypothetical protein